MISMKMSNNQQNQCSLENKNKKTPMKQTPKITMDSRKKIKTQ